MLPATRPPRPDLFAGADLSVLRGRPLEVVQLRLQGLSPSEIAAWLGISVSSVGVYTYFARRTLRMVDARGVTVQPAPPRRERQPAPPPANDILPDLDDAEVPGVVRARARATVGADGRVHAKTIPPGRLSRDERRLPSLAIYPEDVERPRTRGDCAEMPRPCPFVSCAHHLYLDVNDETGAIKLNFPHLEVWEMAETCSLDVADRDGVTLEQTGDYLNISRERVRQLEERSARKIRQSGAPGLR